MKHLKFFEDFTNKVITIGLDVDGTINNFTEAYNLIYKRYFPDKEPIPADDDWNWFKRMDYNGEDPQKWFNSKKAETFEISQPYPDAVNTINNIYDFIKSYGYTLNIVTNQPTEEAKQAAKTWLDKNGFKYDNIVFVSVSKEKWKYVDIMIDDADKVVGNKPLSKVCIKIEQLWNKNTSGDFNIPDIKSLTINLVRKAFDELKTKNTL
jgi:hypothetical protein